MKKFSYFFWNDQLHKKVPPGINRGRDVIHAWNYPEAKRVILNYSTVLLRHKPAFTTSQVCDMIGRHRNTLERIVRGGMIEAPQHTYGLDEKRNFYKYMWREEDIMALHEYLISIHRGRPRQDGEINPQNLPSARELRAMINGENILYVKQGDMFIPSWRAKEF